MNEYNTDKWRIGGEELLLITGLPGGGKTFKSKELGKLYGAVVIHGDAFFDGYQVTNPETSRMVDLYKSSHKRAKFADKDFNKSFKELLTFIIDYHKQVFPRKLVIFESAFTANVDYVDVIGGLPLIILDTGVTKSSFRAIHRNTEDFKDLVASMKDSFISTFLYTMKFKKKMDKFKKGMEENKMTTNKSRDLLYLEELFTAIKSSSNSNHTDEIKAIQRVIQRRYDLDVSINIVKNENMQFFGMSVFPTEDVIDKMVTAAVTGKRMDVIEDLWGKNKRWHIDIDSLLLHDTTLNANPSEIVAVLLHEIGHTARSNEIPQRVGRILKFTYMGLPISTKKILQWTKARRILGLAFIEACSNKNFHTKNMREELAADAFVVKEGYGDDLEKFINKLIVKSGNKLVDRHDSELNHEIDTILTWSISNISELDFRKNSLNKNLQGAMYANKSAFVRNYINGLRGQFFGDTTDVYRNLMIEQDASNEYKKYTVVTESFKDLFNRNGKIDKIETADIDMIYIEANRIQNENDRLYVLELIYAKMDIIDLSLDLLGNPDTAGRVQVTKAKLQSQREDLMTVRKQVMAMKFQDKTYNVVMTYPSGYEG